MSIPIDKSTASSVVIVLVEMVYLVRMSLQALKSGPQMG
jgi:hypothetical protein